MKGIIFDIKEMAIFDGPGIRTTVFLKGCPLKCSWCHNPEGLSFKPELMVSSNGCLGCGRCRNVCPTPEKCRVCGSCVRVCPAGLRKICGIETEAQELAERLQKDSDYLKSVGGGVTFSGGEPLAQPEFLLECIQKLPGIHKAIETSGYCSEKWYSRIIHELDYIIMDLKLINEEEHIRYTGVSNAKILRNLESLKDSGKPFRIRIPVIPGVNDTDENFRATADLLKNADRLEKVELLPYHQTAGAKYSMVNKTYSPQFNAGQKPYINQDIFKENKIKCECL